MIFRKPTILLVLVMGLLLTIPGLHQAQGQDYLPRKWNTRKVNLSFNRYYFRDHNGR